MKKPNDVILQSVTTVISFVIILFSIHLFFAGHYTPGGGFIGGLMTSAALVLLLLAFDIKTLKKILPVNFKIMTAAGLLIAVLTAAGALLFDAPFFKHAYGYFDIPLLGDETSLHTAVIFDIGVYLVVVGIAMTIIQTIGESE